MRRLRLLPALLLALALGGGAPLPAQEPATGVAATEGAVAPSPGLEPAYPAAGVGLPQGAAPPRTLRAYWHVFIAFALAWLLLFGYAIVLGRRFSALEREVERLERGRA